MKRINVDFVLADAADFTALGEFIRDASALSIPVVLVRLAPWVEEDWRQHPVVYVEFHPEDVPMEEVLSLFEVYGFDEDSLEVQDVE